MSSRTLTQVVKLFIIACLLCFEMNQNQKNVKAAIVMFSSSWCSDSGKWGFIIRSIADLVLYTLAGDDLKAAVKIALPWFLNSSDISLQWAADVVVWWGCLNRLVSGTELLNGLVIEGDGKWTVWLSSTQVKCGQCTVTEGLNWLVIVGQNRQIDWLKQDKQPKWTGYRGTG